MVQQKGTYSAHVFRPVMYTPSHTDVCKFYNFQLTFSQLVFHLKCVTKVKVFFLVLVFVFNFDLFKFLAAILEKGLFLDPIELKFVTGMIDGNSFAEEWFPLLLKQ